MGHMKKTLNDYIVETFNNWGLKFRLRMFDQDGWNDMKTATGKYENNLVEELRILHNEDSEGSIPEISIAPSLPAPPLPAPRLQSGPKVAKPRTLTERGTGTCTPKSPIKLVTK